MAFKSDSWIIFNDMINFFLFISTVFVCAQGSVKICHDVHPPENFGIIGNCSVVCSSSFHHYVAKTENDELALCKQNSTLALPCVSHSDCKQHHVGAFCKSIPCLCEGQSNPQSVYILDPKISIPSLDTCIVSTKWIHPDLPVVPFPWRTLLVVCAIVASFAICLIALRWISPFLRAMQAKHTARNNENRRQSANEDGTSLFSSDVQQSGTQLTVYLTPGLPRIYASNLRSASQRARHSRARYTNCRQNEAPVPSNSALTQDKPPPYEVAIQEVPPSYEEYEEQQPLNHTENEVATRNNTEPPQSSIARISSNVSVTTV